LMCWVYESDFAVPIVGFKYISNLYILQLQGILRD
jgi:hypothetical protein